MTAVYAAMLGVGIIAAVVAVVWARLTRHERRIFHNTNRTDQVAIVLELEECVRELEQTPSP
jgi:hypothetical protein